MTSKTISSSHDKNKSIEIQIDVMTDGSVRFCRCDTETNKHTLEIVSKLSPDKRKEVKQFLDCSEHIKLISGDEPLCG